MNNRKKRHVPDVLFVDEEGNPIEAGHENLIYVDEQGNEIPEEIAQQLLESGKYIDSRDLYLASDEMSIGGGGVETASNANAASTVGGNQVQYDLTQPSLPASAFGSLSKSTGANELTMTRKSSYQSLKSAANDDDQQRNVFAQAQAKMRQREDEIREIEADAAIVAANAAVQQQQQQGVGLTNKSMSNTDMQKSHSGRRLLQPPPLKNSQDFKSQESVGRRQQQQQQQKQQQQQSQSAVVVDRPASSQQVY